MKLGIVTENVFNRMTTLPVSEAEPAQHVVVMDPTDQSCEITVVNRILKFGRFDDIFRTADVPVPVI